MLLGCWVGVLSFCWAVVLWSCCVVVLVGLCSCCSFVLFSVVWLGCWPAVVLRRRTVVLFAWRLVGLLVVVLLCPCCSVVLLCCVLVFWCVGVV